MNIAILIFDKITALDAVGPYEVLSRMPGWEVTFVAAAPGQYRTENGMLALTADCAFTDVPTPDVIVIPGGFGTRALINDQPTLDWIRQANHRTMVTASVCTGSLLLGAAGLLQGRRATTHWLLMDKLREFGAEPVSERIVEDGKLLMAAGVSAGIDMALQLAARLAGQEVAEAIQLGIEYDPKPPFNCGSTKTARPEIVELVRARSDQFA